MGEFDRPQFASVDSWGLTHTGLRRSENQDHYLIGALTRGVTVERTSLSEDPSEVSPLARVASLAVVADGVGSGSGGGEAARIAVQALVHEVARSFPDAARREARDPQALTSMLHDAALACHHSLVRRAEHEAQVGHFATTLTLFLGLWPHAYLLQVGDSRCYVYQDGELTQISRDQTVAQELVDQGVLSQTKAETTRWAHVLSSSIGGEATAPVVTRITRDWGTVVLLCSDGLTKHVTDEEIARRCGAMTSSRQLCEDLLQAALDEGGTDNITITVGRTLLDLGG